MKYNIMDATKLKSSKKKAILLGTGKSISNISKELYEKMKKDFDIWGINNFFIHEFIVPDYLHFEIKADINGKIFPEMLSKKYNEYKDVIFISDISTRERDLPYKFLDLNKFKNFYSYRRIDRLLPDGSYNMSSEYKPLEGIVSITFGKSNSKILDIMSRMGYEEIYFCGVDLNNCEYFWTDNLEYDKIDIPEKMRWCGKERTLGGKPAKFEKNDPHPAYELAKFFNDFLNFNKIDCYNLSTNSELKKYMKTKTITQFEDEINGNIR